MDGDVDDAEDGGADAATVAKYHEDVAGATAAMSLAENVADGAAVAATVANYREDAAVAIVARIDQNA